MSTRDFTDPGYLEYAHEMLGEERNEVVVRIVENILDYYSAAYALNRRLQGRDRLPGLKLGSKSILLSYSRDNVRDRS